MSVQQIEAEIAKLASTDLKLLAAWLNDFLPTVGFESRPRVGEITSARVVCTEDCFAPLTDDEMVEMGFA